MNGAGAEGQGDNGGEHMLTEPHPRMSPREGVVERVQQGDGGRAGEDDGLRGAASDQGGHAFTVPARRPAAYGGSRPRGVRECERANRAVRLLRNVPVTL